MEEAKSLIDGQGRHRIGCEREMGILYSPDTLVFDCGIRSECIERGRSSWESAGSDNSFSPDDVSTSKDAVFESTINSMVV